MEFKDYYKILRVQPDADDATIKSEYRKLARKYHPDLNQGDAAAEARFKEINEAHEVLGDPEKRAKYDELRQYRDTYGEWPGAGGPGASPGGPGAGYRFYTGGDGFAEGGGANFGDFSEFFESIFGGGGFAGGGFGAGPDIFGGARGKPGARRGADLRSQLPVTLEELYRGSERSFELNGERIRVRIPAGFPDGNVLKLSGQGQPGHGGGPRGDLLLKIETAPHANFERRGDDLHCDVSVDLYTMLLGGRETLTTPGGSLEIKIPAETRNGVVLRLKGRGMPRFAPDQAKGAGDFGDLYAKLVVRLPERLSEEERETFRRLAGRDPVSTG